MSSRDLADRLGVAQPTLAKLEASEREGRAGLYTLQRAANALDCDFVYALVPRKPIGQMVRDRAEAVVSRDFAAVANSMRLEDQGVDGANSSDAFNDLLAQVANERGLWRDH